MEATCSPPNDDEHVMHSQQSITRSIRRQRRQIIRLVDESLARVHVAETVLLIWLHRRFLASRERRTAATSPI